MDGRALVKVKDVLVGRSEKVQQGVQGVPQGRVGFDGVGGGSGRRCRVDERVGVGSLAGVEERLVVVRAEDSRVRNVERLYARM